MIECPNCAHRQDFKDALFCANCGARLIADKKEPFSSDRLKFWGGELRLLSVIFISFGRLESSSETESFSSTMVFIKECLKEIENIIKGFDGTSNQIIPDTRVLGIFGAPKAHPDDPSRAIHCAIAIKNWWLKKQQSQEILGKVYITIGCKYRACLLWIYFRKTFFSNSYWRYN